MHMHERYKNFKPLVLSADDLNDCCLAFAHVKSLDRQPNVYNLLKCNVWWICHDAI